MTTRPACHEQAASPRVPTCPPKVTTYDYALPPRVPTSTSMDTSEWVLPPRQAMSQREMAQEAQQPRRSPRLLEKIEKLKIDVGSLQRVSKDKTRRSTRLADLNNKRKADAENEKIYTARVNPRRKENVEVRTL